MSSHQHLSLAVPTTMWFANWTSRLIRSRQLLGLENPKIRAEQTEQELQ